MRNSKSVLAVVLACVCGSVAFAQSASSEVSLHLASLTPMDGFDTRAFAGGDVYVSPRAALTEAALLSADSSTTRSQTNISIALNDPGLRRFRDLVRRDRVGHVAVFANGRIVAVTPFTLDTSTSSLTLSGLTSLEAGQVTDLVGMTPAGATIALVPTQSRVFPGRRVSVDIFVSGVRNLRTWQVALEVVGGRSGSMTIEDMQIDHTRSDYVFGTLPKIDAADLSGNRVGGLLMSGSVDATERSYVGTATLVPSADAAGTFNVVVKGGDRASLLWSSENVPAKFRTEAAAITVGGKRKSGITDR